MRCLATARGTHEPLTSREAGTQLEDGLPVIALCARGISHGLLRTTQQGHSDQLFGLKTDCVARLSLQISTMHVFYIPWLRS